MKRKKETSFFHDKITILIFGSLFITFLMVFISISVNKSIQFTKKGSNTTYYKYEYQLSIKAEKDKKNPNITLNRVHTDQEAEKLYQALCAFQKGNISANITVHTGEDYIQRNAQVIFSCSEPLKETIRHQYMDYRNSKNPVVLLGDGYKSLIQDGKIILDGETYEVAGILENKMFANDYRIIIFANNCTTTVKQNILNAMIGEDLSFYFNSSQCKEEELLSEIKNMQGILKDTIQVNSKYKKIKKEDVSETSKTDAEETIEIIRSMNGYMFDVFFVFAMINVFYVIRIWMKRREKELAIRRAFGYSTWEIAKNVFAELFSLEILSSVLALIATGIWMRANDMTMVQKQLFDNLPYYYLVIAVISIFYISMILWKVRKIQPVNGIKQC